MSTTQYLETAVKPSKVTKKRSAELEIDRLNTFEIIWHLVKRHKFGLVSIWAVIITVLYLMPFLPDVILSLFK